jgi:hypothetical protein
VTPSAAWSPRLVCRRLGGLEAASNVLRGVGGRFSSRDRRSFRIRPENAERLRRRPHGLTDAVGCGGRQFSRASRRRGPDRRRQPYTAHASGTIFWRLLDVSTERLHDYERRLGKGDELKRVKECAGLSQHVMEEAETFVRRFFEVVAGFPPRLWL